MEGIKRRLDEGTDLNEIIANDIGAWSAAARHLAFFSYYQSERRKRTRFMPPHVEVFWGETGTGKTRKAYDDLSYDPSKTWRWTPGTGATFMDGYNGQPHVIFDEFRGQISFGQILALLDGYPMTVQIKGGSVHWCPMKIILTSPKSPKDWYPNLPEDSIDQLLRRITKTTHFNKSL